MDYIKEIAKIVKIDGYTADDIEKMIVLPKELSLGDYSLPCFRFAKELKKSPAQIAIELANTTVKNGIIKSVTAVNGYLNFTIDKAEFTKNTILTILKEGQNYGSSDIGKNRVICLDYSSINIAKPFHIGHLSTTVIGASLYRIFNKLGYKSEGINHLGDWGTQFGKLITAYKLWGDKNDIEKRGVKSLLDIYVKFHQEAEKDEKLNDQGRYWFKKIEDGDKEALSIFEWFKEITLKEVQKTYDRLHIHFDSYAGESFYNDKMQAVLDALKQKGLLEESDGAMVVKFDNGDPPCLVQRSDGATLYATRDLAAAIYRKNHYDFYKCLYVVAYQQNLHFRQVFNVLKMMGYDWSNDLVHVNFGMVSLEDGAMSTRKGNIVFLEDVLDNAVQKAYGIIEEKNPNLDDKKATAEKIGVGAIVFSALQNNRIKDTVFSYDKVLNFDGETAPYVQYTYARCCSVLAKTGEIEGDVDFSGVENNEALELAKLLDKYPQTIIDASVKYEPSLVTRLVMDTAQMFNKFYLEHRINDENQAIKNARIMLTQATKIVIEDGFRLLGIQCPTKM
ncbi:MAG: arginine--tRNA ligase [Clostridia bacterium]